MAAETLNSRYEIIEAVPEADTLPFTVAKARDTTEGRVVTLQTLPAQRIHGTVAQRTAFVSAVQQAMPLDHPNVARLYDHGATADGDFFVVGEYTRGITLKERIRRIAPFSLAVAADIGVAVAEALEAAHAAGVVHGDLRPHQVLLSPEGQIKVSNFCYSRAAMLLAADGPDPLYAAYGAPELGARAPGTVAADIFALGAMLYEMLTGAQPARSDEEPPSPRSLNPGVPPALEGIVQKALQPHPSARYRTVAAMLTDLRTVREALRTGRSLAWSPVGERRVPRSPGPAAGPVITPDPSRTMVGEAMPTALGTAEPEPDEEHEESPGRAASRALGIIVATLFVVAVCGIIGLTWYFTRFIAIPNDIQVPNLIGKTFEEAKQIADRDHFQLVERNPDTPHYSARWPENQIYQQDPPPLRTIKAGREVYVLKSAGPPLLMVPDLTGMNQDRAEAALKDANLPLGVVTQDYSDTITKGEVISQQPGKRAMTPRNTAVNFVVSEGRQPPDVPEDVVATPADPTTVTLTWKPAARAETYTVTRSQDGNATTVAEGLKSAQITDKSLTPATSYTYSVNAINAGGNSGPSEPITVQTPPIVPVPPALAPDLPAGSPTPDATGGSGDNPPPGGDTGSPRLRQFTIAFRVPRHPRRQRHVQFEIQDALGVTPAFDEWRDPGSNIDAPVHAFGNRITFRIFLDGKLNKQQTL